MKRVASVGLLCVTCAGAAWAQAPETPYRLQVQAREVVMAVVVQDAKGRSVHGLTSADFQVVEDGVPQAVRSASEHVAMTPEEVARLSVAKLPVNSFSNDVPPGNTNAVTVILIDGLDSPLLAQMYVLEQVKAFVKTMPPGNTFAVFQLDRSLHLVQGFTSDRDQLVAALASKREQLELPAGLSQESRKAMLNASLRVMDRYLEAYPGRKNLVWFTSTVPGEIFGLKSNPFPDALDYDARSARGANAQSLSRVAIYPIDGRGLSTLFADQTARGKMEQVAERTGGKAFHDTNGLQEALREITETSSNYYTLAYAPTNGAWNAHHREVEVTVRGQKKYRLLYRHLYYGRKERREQRRRDAKGEGAQTFAPVKDAVAMPEFAEAMELGSVPAGGLLFHVSITPGTEVVKLNPGEPLPPDTFLDADARKKAFRNEHLLFTVDPDRVNLEVDAQGVRHARLRYAVVVYRPDGTVANSLASAHEMSMDQATYECLLRGEKKLGLRMEIAVPEKGSYFLRMGVQDLNGENVGSLEVPVDQVVKGVAGPGMVLEP